MLDFKKPVIADKPWVDECLKYVKSFNCEYTFGNLLVWSASYLTTICRYKDFLMCRWGRNNNYRYSVPIGKGDFKDAVLQILEDAELCGAHTKIYGVTEYYKNLMDELFPGKFSYEYDDGYNDYIYSVEKMAQLRGKKYHGKRNHITNFKKNNSEWSFEILDKSNISECIDLHTQWIKNHEDEADYSYEFEAVLTAFENYERLGFVGGLLRVDGRVIAYTMGERHSDSLFVTHFEKASVDVQGAYPTINQEFTRNCLMSYAYVNREEDLGLEGLRRAKRSYHPEIILKKSVAAYHG